MAVITKRKVLKFTNDQKLEEVEERFDSANDKTQKRFLNLISLASDLGFSVSLPIVGGALLGRYLDSQFGLSPRMTLLFILLGVFLGLAIMIAVVKENSK